MCLEEAFVSAVTTAAHLLRVESKICKAAAFQRLHSAVEQQRNKEIKLKFWKGLSEEMEKRESILCGGR